MYHLSDLLRERGWLLPAYTLPEKCQKVVVQRVLIRHGCSFDLMELLLSDISRAIEKLKSYPPAKNLTPTGSFNHGR